MLLKVATHFNSHLSLERVLQAICEEINSAIRVNVVSITLFNEGRDAIYVAEQQGSSFNYTRQAATKSKKAYDEIARKSRTTIVIPDIQAMTNAPDYEMYIELNVRTVVIVGMFRDEIPVGILTIGICGAIREFTQNELTLLQNLAHLAAQSIINAQLFEKANRRLYNLQALRSIDDTIRSSLNVEFTLQILLKQIATQMNVDAVAILQFDLQSQELEYTAIHGFRTKRLKRTRLQIGKGLAGKVVLEQSIISIIDLSTNPKDLLDTDLFNNEEFTSYYGLPLIVKGKIKGVLEIFNRQIIDLDSEWLDFLEALAGQAAFAIDNSTLFAELQRSNFEMAVAYDTTIESWSRVLELRDKETYGHTLRVTEITLDLASRLNITQSQLIHIRRGALLHDIGKMGIPDSILLKPDQLTTEERTIIETHPILAYDWLLPITFLRPALDIPYNHHEKWDGTGYPRKLKGTQIPFAARIFAVVDVWDALRSDRPYRPAWKENKIREYIFSQSGIHFDPEVVKTFMAMPIKDY